MTNSKKKGNAGENAFADFMQEHGVQGWRDGASGGGNRSKSDINNNVDLTIEVKTVKRANVRKIMRQAEIAAEKHRNTPISAIRLDGMPKGEWYIVMKSGDWIEMLVAARAYQSPAFERKMIETTHDTRDIKYKLSRAILSNKELLKSLDEYGESIA